MKTTIYKMSSRQRQLHAFDIAVVVRNQFANEVQRVLDILNQTMVRYGVRHEYKMFVEYNLGIGIIPYQTEFTRYVGGWYANIVDIYPDDQLAVEVAKLSAHDTTDIQKITFNTLQAIVTYHRNHHPEADPTK